MKPVILITRPLEQARDFARDVEAMGYAAMIEPLLEIRDVEFTLPRGADAYQGLILSSSHAVRAAVRTGVRLDIPLFVVGGHTESAAREAGFLAIEYCAPTARALAEAMTGRSGLHLHLRGLHTAFPLPDCDEVVVYEARAAEKFSDGLTLALQEGTIAAVTLFSRRTAEVFLSLYAPLNARPIRLLCFGESVLECAGMNETTEAYVSRTPDREAFLSLLRTHVPLSP